MKTEHSDTIVIEKYDSPIGVINADYMAKLSLSDNWNEIMVEFHDSVLYPFVVFIRLCYEH